MQLDCSLSECPQFIETLLHFRFRVVEIHTFPLVTKFFLDPDNGFEPDGGCSEKHVTYAEVDRLLNTISPGSIISVFQHHRRKKFDNDFAQIRACLRSGYATAIYWHSLMFITVASSTKMIGRVLEVNREYARSNPVKVIA
jgi:hypothetical protein